MWNYNRGFPSTKTFKFSSPYSSNEYLCSAFLIFKTGGRRFKEQVKIKGTATMSSTGNFNKLTNMLTKFTMFLAKSP